MKTKGKYLDDPTAEICRDCQRRTVELTLQSIGIPTETIDKVLEKVEILEHREKILAAERARVAEGKLIQI